MFGVKKLITFMPGLGLSQKPPIGPSPPLSLGQTLKNGSAYVSDDSESKKKIFFFGTFSEKLRKFFEIFRKKIFFEKFFW